MNRLSNAWRLAKASWQVLSQDRELVLVPVVAAVGAVLAFAVVASPGALIGGGDESSGSWALWLFGLLALLAATWVFAVGQATVVAGAGQRMEGGNPTIGTAFAQARNRLGRIFEWAVLATVVAVVLDFLEERLGIAGRIVAWLGGAAFSILSFLALPVIVFEDVGAIEAFKRSARLLKSTWGEQVAFSFGMGLLGFLVALPAILVGGLLLATGVVVLQAVGVVVALVWIGLVAATVSALSAVFKTALYRYAVGDPVDPAFSPADLSGAFRRR
ncbi:MAG TPA: DUF6159 family protein [Acidimicrobiales bacterium]